MSEERDSFPGFTGSTCSPNPRKLKEIRIYFDAAPI